MFQLEVSLDLLLLVLQFELKASRLSGGLEVRDVVLLVAGKRLTLDLVLRLLADALGLQVLVVAEACLQIAKELGGADLDLRDLDRLNVDAPALDGLLRRIDDALLDHVTGL